MQFNTCLYRIIQKVQSGGKVAKPEISDVGLMMRQLKRLDELIKDFKAKRKGEDENIWAIS